MGHARTSRICIWGVISCLGCSVSHSTGGFAWLCWFLRLQCAVGGPVCLIEIGTDYIKSQPAVRFWANSKNKYRVPGWGGCCCSAVGYTSRADERLSGVRPPPGGVLCWMDPVRHLDQPIHGSASELPGLHGPGADALSHHRMQSEPSWMDGGSGGQDTSRAGRLNSQVAHLGACKVKIVQL